MKDEQLKSAAPEKAVRTDKVLRIGLVAVDPLRVLGLQAIVGSVIFEGQSLGGARRAEVVPLSVPGVLQDRGLSIVLIDASCTGHLFELLAMFRRVRPQIRVIIIGESTDQTYIQRVIGAGAKGYLTQTVQESEIRTALEIVNDGSVWAPRKVLARLLEASQLYRPGEDAASVRFTDREVEVLRYLVTGMGNREIAEELSIDESTVKAHLSRLMRKVGAKNRIELTLRALKHHLSDPVENA